MHFNEICFSCSNFTDQTIEVKINPMLEIIMEVLSKVHKQGHTLFKISIADIGTKLNQFCYDYNEYLSLNWEV